ncbi:MAG: Na-K-Cl cotransporter [Polyangia bacterium]|jgi:amino acid transporter|nr:Na-K-Cl cotransporter [Polyangia bacterium]
MSRFRAVLTADEHGKFGTFAGVFTPSVLTILGVIMYLRFPWVVGHAGLGGALLILGVAQALTIPTALSVASIATNRKVKGGGDYYMLSRSLGLEVGGAIGVALFFAQALSVSLYTLGFTEAFIEAVPGLPGPVVAVVTTLLVAGLAFWDTSFAIKSQFFIMALILLSLVSIFLGPVLGPSGPIGGAPAGDIAWWGAKVGGEPPEPFIAVFAVFFPAVTGFTQGVSMSGDLRDPRKSLPLGTFAAVAIGIVVYSAVLVLAGVMAEPAELRRLDTFVLKNLSAVGLLVTLGVLGATLSSALGSVLGAPRILQALGQDRVVPSVFGKGFGPTNMPRTATVVTLAVALAGIGLAYLSPSGLNVIASVITMFFLASYGFISLACGLATWSRTPSFRPSFKVPAFVSLAGAGGCFYVMSLINLPAMLASVAIMGLIYFSLTRRSLSKAWGDLRHGLWSALVRKGLAALRDVGYHPLNWQPHMVVLGGSPLHRPHLLKLGHWIAGQRGMITYFFLRTGDLAEEGSRIRKWEDSLASHLSRDYPSVFTKVQMCEHLFRDALTAVQAHGVPGFSPNSVLVGWSHDKSAAEDYVALLRGLVALDKCLLLVSFKPQLAFGRQKIIEIWWGGLQHNGGLMMLLATLMQESEEWKGARVLARMIARPGQPAELLQRNLERILEEARVTGEAEVIVPRPGEGSPVDIIAGRSRGDLVLLGLRPPDPGEDAASFVNRIAAMVNRLPSCMLIKANSDFEGAEMLFEKEWAPRKRTELRIAKAATETGEATLQAPLHVLEGEAVEAPPGDEADGEGTEPKPDLEPGSPGSPGNPDQQDRPD